jgi:hypothetical protein
MKTISVLILTLCAAASAWADFSYTTTRKSPGPAAAAGPTATKHYFKGQKMLTDNGNTAMLIDFDAQTITNIDKTQKTFTPIKFSELPDILKQSDIEVKADVKETGQKKVINGFNATEMVITMAMDSPQMSQSGMKMQMEVSSWISSDVPGSQELKSFFQRNASNFPWAAIGGGASGMQKAMTDLQRKMAASGGVALLQVVRMKSAGNEAQAAQMQAGMAQARAQMEAMAKQGGPGAAAAQQALARMGGPAAGGALFEVTMESSGFSTASIPDSVFAIPADFHKK